MMDLPIELKPSKHERGNTFRFSSTNLWDVIGAFFYKKPMDLFCRCYLFSLLDFFQRGSQQKTTGRNHNKQRHKTFSENLHHKSNPSTLLDFEDETCKLSSQDLVVLHS